MARIVSESRPIGQPRWLGEPYDPYLTSMPGGAMVVASQFPETDGEYKLTFGAAAAAATSVTATVSPSTLRVEPGVYLATGNKVINVTAPAEPNAAGQVTLTVSALAAAVVANDVAWYKGTRAIESGTLIGRTQAERDAGTAFGPWAVGDTDSYLVLFTNPDPVDSPNIELVRPGVIVKENFLPNWATIGAQAQAEIRSRYRCIIGAPVPNSFV